MQTSSQLSIEDYEKNAGSLGTNPLSGISYCFPTIWKVFTQHYFFSRFKTKKKNHIGINNVYTLQKHQYSFFIVKTQYGLDGKHKALKREVIDDKLEFALRHRYLHFPINLNEHWTIVVFDTEDGTWRHYNSLSPRANIRDPHLTVAESLVPHLTKSSLTNVS